ncbi:cysteine desulfurase [Pilibacter termitis]|uniref:Cysteine desulfurase n=1 Tax=Pilibacter termitis TaxID=263852 RepID=A0A1T4LYE0_9ENTE|nr:cysteine desulfurase family protein [Pilibacter termitis]SJZ59651.1 cysteine desulfurase [Pilibacter termitis]
MIYFDNAATTIPFPEVLDTYMKTSQRIIGNPSSLHSLGEEARRLLVRARGQVADILGVKGEEIFFTSGGTESDNWALKGSAIAKKNFGRHIIISAIEHPAVYETANQLELLGFEISRVGVDNRGMVKLDELSSLIRKDTILVSIMAVNNEIGSIQPISAIGELLEHYPNIHFHVDAVQAVGKIPTEKYLHPRVDFASFSAHKFHGVRGVGFLYAKKGKDLAPLLTGGGQESNRRSTTENVAGIVSSAKALRLYMEKVKAKENHLQALQKYLLESLKTYENVTLFTECDEDFSPHIVTFGLRGVRGEVLVHAFEEKQIYISTTSACSSRKKYPASTLKAMNVPTNLSETAVRVSLDESNTMAEVEQFLIVFRLLSEKFAKIS